MKETDKRCIAALFQDDKPVLFVSTHEEDVEKYKEKGLSFSVDDLLFLMNTDTMPPVVVHMFPDATFEAVVKEKPKSDLKAWWT